jgi:hypothetical protein
VIELPALRSLFFVALDENDMAVKRMHSFLTVQPGEVLGCVGCHEPRTESLPAANSMASLPRRPSRIEPISDAPTCFDFPRDIQPILDQLCVDCHGYQATERGGPYAGGIALSGDRGPMFSHAYFTMTVQQLFSDNRNRAVSNLPPRSVGSAASRILTMLDGSHHGVVADEHQRRMLRLWIEVGAPYPGTYAALGTGSIGGYAENKLVHTDFDWPTTLAGADVIQRRCADCHQGDLVLPLSISDERNVSFWRFDIDDPRLRLSRHIVFNLTQPEHSLLLLSPLGCLRRRFRTVPRCRRSAGEVFSDRADPDYATLLDMVSAGRDELERIKRFDMPGFQPRPSTSANSAATGSCPPTTRTTPPSIPTSWTASIGNRSGTLAGVCDDADQRHRSDGLRLVTRARGSCMLNRPTKPSRWVTILDETGFRGGLVVHLGCGDGRLTVASGGGRWCAGARPGHVPGEHPAGPRAGRGAGRLGTVTADVFDGRQLPLIDDVVNLLVVEALGGVSRDEMLRVLAPGGVLYEQHQGRWIKLVKPWPDDIDQWTHYLYDASNNAVSKDRRVQPPEHLQWQCGPRWSRHHDHMASVSAMVSAAGRVFYILDEGSPVSPQLPPDWQLVARDGFNGVLLWKRPIAEWHDALWPLKSGPADLPRRLVAVGDVVYTTLGITAPVSALDAATGDAAPLCGHRRGRGDPVPRRTLAGSGQSDAGRLRRRPGHGSGEGRVAGRAYDHYSSAMGRLWAGIRSRRWSHADRVLRVLDADSGQLLWEHADRMLPLTLGADAENVYYHDGERIVALQLATGRPRWRSEPIPVWQGLEGRGLQSWFAPTLVATERPGAVRRWREDAHVLRGLGLAGYRRRHDDGAVGQDGRETLDGRASLQRLQLARGPAGRARQSLGGLDGQRRPARLLRRS